MAPVANQHNKVEQDFGEKRQLTRQPKTRRQRKSNVKLADNVQAVTLSKKQNPKSISNTKSTALPTSSASSHAQDSPLSEPPAKLDTGELDKDEKDALRVLAEAAIKVAKNNEKKELEQELTLTKTELGNAQFNASVYKTSSDDYRRALEDAKRCAKITNSDLQQAQWTISSLENRLKVMKGRLVGAERQVEQLQCGLAIARGAEP